ncbi:MAG: hypothetical protein VX699_03115 [Myxococcota bacterium]|nr:hypothetical protein [Myxococcota bacterium]
MFDAVKVFSATKHKERDELGEKITRWLSDREDSIEIVDTVIRQSSDSEYHCLSITIFYNHK